MMMRIKFFFLGLWSISVLTLSCDQAGLGNRPKSPKPVQFKYKEYTSNRKKCIDQGLSEAGFTIRFPTSWHIQELNDGKHHLAASYINSTGVIESYMKIGSTTIRSDEMNEAVTILHDLSKNLNSTVDSSFLFGRVRQIKNDKLNCVVLMGSVNDHFLMDEKFEGNYLFALLIPFPYQKYKENLVIINILERCNGCSHTDFKSDSAIVKMIDESPLKDFIYEKY